MGRRSPTSAPTRCSPTTGSRSAATTSRRPAATARTCSASPRSGSSPRRRVTGRSAWVRLFDELTSAITVDLDGDDGRASSRASRGCSRPTATCAAPPPKPSPSGSSPGCARGRSCSTRCSPTSRSTTGCATTRRWIASRNLANEASDESVQALVDAVQAPLRHPAALVHAEGAAARARPARRLRPHGVGRQRRRASSAGTRPRRSCSTRTRRSRPSSPTPRSGSSTSRGSTRRCGRASGPGAFCAYTVPSPAPVPVAQLDVAPPRRAHARARARSRPARVPRPRAGRLPPDHAADAGRDRVGVRRDGHVRAPARRRPTIPATRLALLAESLEGQIATVFRQIAMNRFEDRVHTQRRERGRAVGRRLQRAVGRHADRDARRRGRDHRRLPHVVVVHPALHRHARVRVRVRVRAAARAVGVPRVRGAGRRRSCPQYLELLAAGGSTLARGARRDRRPRPRRPRVLGRRPRDRRPSSSKPPKPPPRRPDGSSSAPPSTVGEGQRPSTVEGSRTCSWVSVRSGRRASATSARPASFACCTRSR